MHPDEDRYETAANVKQDKERVKTVINNIFFIFNPSRLFYK